MKTLAFFFLFVFSIEIYAQDSLKTNPFRFGVGITSGTKTWATDEPNEFSFGIGLSFIALKPFSSKISFAPDVSIFFPIKRSNNQGQVLISSSQYYEIGANFQYNIFENVYNRIYLLAGPVYSLTSLSVPTSINGETGDNVSFKNNAVGFNIGYGTSYPSHFYYNIKYQKKFSIDKKDLFHFDQNNTQLTLTIGYLFNRSRKSSTEVEQ